MQRNQLQSVIQHHEDHIVSLSNQISTLREEIASWTRKSQAITRELSRMKYFEERSEKVDFLQEENIALKAGINRLQQLVLIYKRPIDRSLVFYQSNSCSKCTRNNLKEVCSDCDANRTTHKDEIDIVDQSCSLFFFPRLCL